MTIDRAAGLGQHSDMRELEAKAPAERRDEPSVAVGLNAVIITVQREVPRVLTVDLGTETALPFGPLDPREDVTLERALLRWVREQTGLELDWVEQLYTFGDQHRNPRELTGGPRIVSVAYLVLVEAGRRPSSPGARWSDGYAFFPWEDWRQGRPAIIDDCILPVLERWCAAGDDAEHRRRRERVDIAFGRGDMDWDGDRVLDRYELLYEVGLVEESHRDAGQSRAAGVEPRYPPWLPDDQRPGLARALPDAGARESPDPDAGSLGGSHPALGQPMAHDHRRILATALGRLRGKIRYRPVVFELLRPTFTLLELQRVVESLSGLRLHKGNFRRLVEKGRLVEGTGTYARTGGRPAERFRFRREVLRERRAPGVGLPGGRRAR